MSEIEGDRINAVAPKLSASTRVLLGRLSMTVVLIDICALMTLGLIGSHHYPLPFWFGLAVGLPMVLLLATAPLQLAWADRQVAHEQSGGYTTNRWADTTRPEVAPGTNVIIRPVGFRPIPLGQHRKALRWAKDVEAGDDHPVDFRQGIALAIQPRRQRRGDPWTVGALLGGFAYMVWIIAGAVGLVAWQFAVTLAPASAIAATISGILWARSKERVRAK